ncbi:MAG: MerR family transcriptional regulator [Chloroflexi bacterium]|nr:MerR family transcriptional regulator [Chloroflexota bacterium]
MSYTVKKVAEMASVSVRTLHYYDQIGLLRSSSTSEAGYRLYSDADLDRLQEILFFRELRFGLKEIKAIVESPGFDRKEALRAHRQLLAEQQRRLGQLVELADRTIDALERGQTMDEQARFSGFDDSKLEAYREEARQRWGHTEAYKESERRAASYTRADWDAIKAESQEIERHLAALADRDPADPEVQRWIARHHQQINDRFYTCSLEVYRGLGDLYVDDPRFAAYYDRVRPGLARFMREAMRVHADRLAAS